MAALTSFMENHVIDWLLRAQAIGITGATAAAATGPATVYVALYTTNPTATTTGTEVSGGSYARVAVTSALTAWAGTQGAATTVVSSGTTGQTSNNTILTFPAPTAAWGVITGFAMLDALTLGNMLIFGALTTSKTVNSGDAAPSFAAAALTFSLS